MKRVIATLAVILTTALSTEAQEVKNIIYLIGDGMGLTSASMMQLENNYETTIFDEADNVALQKTYSLDNRVTDSAASGTALATGFKTNNTMLGQLPDGTNTESLMELAADKGKATGVVVTTYLQHATPGAFYAHAPSRHEYATISEQLLASDIDIAIGGGMAFFKERYNNHKKATKAITESGFALVESLDADMSGERILALLADKEIENRTGYLAKATTAAIEHLDNNDNGFVLMVEGSLIDGMGHGNNAEGQQAEMRDFMEAIEVAVAYAREHTDTLVVVTADHETGGLAIISGNADFNLSEQGVEYKWATGGHSGVMVPIYLYGTGAELINGVMENADLGKRLKELIQ
ncbi:MAG: alkaline phosphatase [Alistipes sp.]|nr:alkaline phosphatase [Alistipes sp.]